MEKGQKQHACMLLTALESVETMPMQESSRSCTVLPTIVQPIALDEQ